LVEVGHEQATYSLLGGLTLEIVHHGEKANVEAERPLTRLIPPRAAREAPSQPPGRAPARRRAPP
jgi:alpha,alpha-trehalose phosphorylase